MVECGSEQPAQGPTSRSSRRSRSRWPRRPRGRCWSGRRTGVRAVAHKSTLTDLVTDIDRAIEGELVQALRERRPDDAVRGEEGGVHSAVARTASGVEWVLDPIDGTVNFVLGIPWFSVSVAACVGGRSVAGCVADPNRGESFHARLGGGSFLRTAAGSLRLTGPRTCRWPRR